MWDPGSEGWDAGSEGWDPGSEGWDPGSEGWDLGSQPQDQGSQAMQFFEGSSCTIFVGSGTKICHTFGIKDKKFGNKNEIGDEKPHLIPTLL